MTRHNVREFYRINYRSPDQPILEFGKHKFVVIDLSEAGLRFLINKAVHFTEMDPIEAIVHFSQKRGSIPIKGVVIRATQKDVAIIFDDKGRIPLAKIMEEQRFLISKGKL